MLAPIVLFVYNREDHVKRTLLSLSRNAAAKESALFIFSDGNKTKNDEQSVNRVRELISLQEWKSAFKEVNIILSDRNKGLATSIISGVDKIIHEYGRVIVIEDDCISRGDFLDYMNVCLDFYKNNEKIWSIGGYSANLAFPSGYSHDVYLMGRTCSYAWGTWVDRWDRVDWQVKDYDSFKYNLIKRRQFNKYGNDRARMLDLQQLGKKNSWAIRFCYAMFKNGMYTVYPTVTRIKNIGYDEGTHVNIHKSCSKPFDVILSNEKMNTFIPENVDLDKRIVKSFVRLFKRPWYKLLVSYIINVIIGSK